jgi:hypothetical protein
MEVRTVSRCKRKGTVHVIYRQIKANLYKCFPMSRVWPQKCERCLQEALDCSEPHLHPRKQGDNFSKPARQSKTQSIPDRQKNRARETDDDNSSEASDYNNPLPTMAETIKREQTLDPVPKVPLYAPDDQCPASAYLPLAEGEFRILRLAPGRKDDEEVVCSFVTASMSQRLQYEAISCLWASTNATKQKSSKIKLQDSQENFYSIFTSNNVHAALRNLRHPKDERLFWLDALCIDHSNSGERNRQAAMKPGIFRNADNLCFWVGEDANSKAALSFIPRILDHSGIDKLVQEDQAIDGWVALVGFLKNTVFNSLWLIQEVAVARNVTLYCGQRAIHYQDFVDAVGMFASCRANLALLFQRNQENIKQLTDQIATMAERFIDASTNSLRVTVSGRIRRRLTIEALVSKLSVFRTTNHLDRIFTVLALAKDGPPLIEDTLMEYSQEPGGALEIEIDYTKSVLEVYQDFVSHAIGQSLSLDIICRRWASSVSEQELILPTWVRPLQPFLQPPFDSNISERTDADCLVGIPDRNYYHASRGTMANYRIVPILSVPRRSSLSVRGIRIDKIFKLGALAPEGIILREWLELGGCNIVDKTAPEGIILREWLEPGGCNTVDKTAPEGIMVREWLELGDCNTVNKTAPKNFWRTLVADRGPNGSRTPSWYNRAFLYCLHHLTPNGNINMNQLIAEDAASSRLIVSFLQRVQAVIWNRKFLVSWYNCWIGLAPMAAEVEDIICILYGCSVPVVLRPQKDKSGESFYYLVGECYVDGMMDGVAVKTAKANGYFEDVFEIR